jgi:mxaA protein
MKRLLLIAALLLHCALAAAQSMHAGEPRAYGYVLGDVITQRVPLMARGEPFIPEALPPAGRVGRSFWRRGARIERDEAGQPWLAVEYQLINAPQTLEVWFLPALQLKGADPRSGVLDIAPWRFSVGPLTPQEGFRDEGLGAMRGDKFPAPISLAPLERRIRLAAAALVLTLLLWIASLALRRHLMRRRLPFAAALRDLRRMPDDTQEAWRRMQHALNEAAGEVVRTGNLDVLIQRRPWLQGERVAIEQFCRDASAFFFGGDAPAAAYALRQFARRLSTLERRHAS